MKSSHLLHRPDRTVKLSVRDILMLFLYDGTQETIDETRAAYAGKFLRVRLDSLEEGGTLFRVATSTHEPTPEDIAKDYEDCP